MNDHLGSTSRITDASGNNPAVQLYKAWGETRYSSGTLPTTYLYTGQRREQSLGGTDGLYFYGARWLDPYLGRFIQMDPLLPVIGKPQTCDKCAYADNNPTNHVDPTGNSVDDCGLPGIACSINIENKFDRNRGTNDQQDVSTPKLSTMSDLTKNDNNNENQRNRRSISKNSTKPCNPIQAAAGAGVIIVTDLFVGLPLLWIIVTTAGVSPLRFLLKLARRLSSCH